MHTERNKSTKYYLKCSGLISGEMMHHYVDVNDTTITYLAYRVWEPHISGGVILIACIVLVTCASREAPGHGGSATYAVRTRCVETSRKLWSGLTVDTF
jgi:hypothetical protein